MKSAQQYYCCSIIYLFEL